MPKEYRVGVTIVMTVSDEIAARLPFEVDLRIEYARALAGRLYAEAYVEALKQFEPAPAPLADPTVCP